MKRFALLFVSALLVLAPMSASALEMMTDASMKDVTGQAGVSIAIDDVVIYQEGVADTTYWDTDGLGEGAGMSYGVNIAYDGLSKKLITIDAIYNPTADPDGLGAGYMEAALGAAFKDLLTDPLGTTGVTGIGFDLTGPHPLTIDVGKTTVLSAGYELGTAGAITSIAGVIIGLPTVEIVQYHSNDRKAISVVVEEAAAMGNVDNKIIEIEKNGTSKMAILGGFLEIAPH